MTRSSIRGGVVAAVALLATAITPAIATATATSAARQPFVVCKHGCRYTTIQGAVNASGRGATIEIKPGTYSEGVIVQGHAHDGLTIEGIGKTPSAVYLNGTHARRQHHPAQNAIEGDGVDALTIENMQEEHYAADGFFITGANATHPCHGYLMKNLIAGFDHAYGLDVFGCVGGRMTESTGYGNGDAGFSIAGTPFQKQPVWSSVDHDTAYENVLGYSGTNAKYVKITDGAFYDNGAGVVPNTLVSGPFEPASDGIIANNTIFWNNFDYDLPGSPVRTVSSGLPQIGGVTANYPIGAGILLFGTTGWVAENNQIFGNWLWGAAAFSSPLADPDAINDGNRFVDNQMGDNGNDLNGTDFFDDGSGTGTCFANNGTHPTLVVSSTAPSNVLYPTCPTTAGTATVTGDATQQSLLLSIVTADPPASINRFWTRHPHIPITGLKPLGG